MPEAGTLRYCPVWPYGTDWSGKPSGRSAPLNVTVFGAGYVGLVSGVCLANSGHSVHVVDIDERRITRLRGGDPCIYEPGLEDLMSISMSEGRLTFDTVADLVTFGEAVIVAVGTPSSPVGAADLSAVRGVVALIAKTAPAGAVLIMKSTVPPGTGLGFEGGVLAGTGVRYASNPEFLREGSAIQDWYRTDRIVVGASDPATFEVTRALYHDIDATFVECDIASAEMVKYASNAFLATKISFINEIAVLCDRVGAQVDDVAYGLGLDSRIGSAFLNAGIGYGGSCFPKDTRALDFLSAINGYDFHLLKAVIEVNARQRLLPVIALQERFGDLAGREVAVLGVTFKPDTDDTREAPAVDIITMLASAGAVVRAHDPVGILPADVPAQQHDDVLAALAGADAAVLAVEWPAYRTMDWAAAAGVMRPSAVVFDGRNWLDRATIEGAGLAYLAVGRPAR
jgi:UDPglucose 6-dehydrogenase